ncbi:hypothetical protein Pla100_34160 [Neorhodopirellula pilleata]|uniref:Uncharacterized protein n=1 Tax=Neorhodopirellula pilleata TaxID=2714738 RepID=A0A5C6A780_9BACT|nr:hypothetical protein Pla100_34160 [Neorhodopirellula pilleata]
MLPETGTISKREAVDGINIDLSRKRTANLVVRTDREVFHSIAWMQIR